MLQAWLVTDQYGIIYGVFSSPDKAMDAVAALDDAEGELDLLVEEWEVDQMEEPTGSSQITFTPSN